MKTYRIDECLIREIIDVLEKRRDELPYTTFHSNYIEKECQNSKALIEKLKNLKRLKRFILF